MFFALVSLSTTKYFKKKKFEKIIISFPGKKFDFFISLKCKIDCRLKKDSRLRGYVRFCYDFFFNLPRCRINKIRRTEFLFRSTFDLFSISKIEFDFSTVVF